MCARVCVNTAGIARPDVSVFASAPPFPVCFNESGAKISVLVICSVNCSALLIIQDLEKKKKRGAEDRHLIPFPLALYVLPACRVLFLGHEVEDG